MSRPTPALWSDFDGTAVEIASKTDPRNWSKYPLPAVKGYVEFLQGVQETGVEIAGIVSRRPNLFLRRIATARSIKMLGYGSFFTDPDKIIHAGSEEAKGKFIAGQTAERPIGMLEDKPHNLGPIIVGALIESVKHPEAVQHPLLLGVVSHAKSREYVDRMLQQAADRTAGTIEITETAVTNDEAFSAGFRLQSDNLDMHVAILQPYTQEAGRHFGEALLSL